MIQRLFLSAALVCAAAGYSYGGCTTTGTTTSCTNSTTITIPQNTTQTGTISSSAQTVTGVVGSISTISLTLNNWTDNTTNNISGGSDYTPADADRLMMLVFQPTGCSSTSCLQTFQFLGGFGSYESLTNETVTFEDSATNYAPDSFDGQSIAGDTLTNPGTYKPTVNGGDTQCSGTTNAGNNGDSLFQSPAPVFIAPCARANPNGPGETSDGTATFGSQFSGSPNGTWTLWVETWHNGTDAQATIGGWTLNITVQANAANTTTSMSSNATNNETFETDSVTLTATVSSTSTVSEGTVAFTDNGNTISGCGSQPVSGGMAICTTSFSTEGNHPLKAAYTGDANFGNSSGNMNFFVDHATTTPSSGQYCNTGTMTISTSGSGPGTTPYPQHIFVPSTVTGTVSDISLTLPNITIGGIAFFNLLLVDPHGNKFVPLAGTGGFGNASNVTLTLSDFAGMTVPNPTGGVPQSGTYLATDLNSGLSFASSPNGPPSGPYQLPQTQGGATFDTTFAGSSSAGMWSLYAFYASGESTGSIGGYCLNITTSAAAATTTTVSSSPNAEATTGENVTFTATVKSGGNPVTSGTVTFKENGTVLGGPTAVDSSTGQATFQTSSLAEGIHNITANYSGVSGNYNVSSGQVTIEIDTATTNPSSGLYCNAGGIVSGLGTQNIPAAPYPSRIYVTSEAGTVNTVGVQLNSFSDGEEDGTVMLLEGPTSTNTVFWNGVGPTDASGFPSLNLTIADSAGSANPVPTNSAPSNDATYYPTADLSGFPMPVFPAPGPTALSFAPSIGSQTFATAFQNINPNGYWMLYVYDRFGSPTTHIGNWCLSVVNNPPVVTLANAHSGTFTQGDTADTYTITVSNPSGPGSTGGTMTLTDTLPAGMTASSIGETANTGGGTGSDWSCSGTTCTRTTPMPSGEIDTITLTVGVSYNTSTATNGAVNNVSLSGGGISGGTVTAQDTQTVQPGPGYALTINVSPTSGGSVGANPTNSTGLASGHYLPGTPVTLTATPASGYIFSSWNANPDLSSTTISTPTITVNSATESVTANFTPAPSSIAPNAGTPQSATEGTVFSNALQVKVTNTNGVVVPNVMVTFAPVAAASGASATFPSGNTATTDSNGLASIGAKANTIAGAYTVTASVSGVSTPAIFSLTNNAGNAASVSISGGNNQSATVGFAFTQSLQVTVKDSNNNPVPNASVTFVGPASGASATFATSPAITNASGVASVTATANSTAGSYTVTATVSGLIAAGFSLTNNPGNAAHITVASGSGQSTAILTAFANALVVTVTDSNQNAVPGATVTFTAGSATGGASATLSTPAITNSSGQTSVSATANSHAGGPYTVSASVAGITSAASFLLTNTPGQPAHIVVTSGSGQTALLNQPFANPLLVTVTDSGNNAVSGATVTFAAPASGASATLSTPAPTNSSGQTSVNATANGIVGGPYVITASSGTGTTTPGFSLTNTTQYQLTTAVSPSGAGAVSPASGGNYTPGTVVSINAAPNAGYVFKNWTASPGSVANANSASTSITMSAPESVTANFTEGATKLNTSLASTIGPLNARQWTFSIVNTGPGAANAAQISSLTLSQNSGTACAPTVTTPVPINLGNLAPTGSISSIITIDFSGCSSTAKFTVNGTLSANSGAATGTILLHNEKP